MLSKVKEFLGFEITDSDMKNLRRLPSIVIPFLLMHFIYFPLIAFEFIFNYMAKNGFFSYELITENFFVVSLSTGVTFLVLAAFSIMCWGALAYFFLLKKKVIKRSSFMWAVIICTVFMQILMWLTIATSNNPMVLLTVYFSSLVLGMFYCFYFTSDLKAKIFWVAALTVMTSYLQLTAGEYASDLFGKSLKKFGIGGGIQVDIILIDKNYKVQKGTMTLMTPDFVYMKSKNGAEVIPMVNVRQIIRPYAKL
ncbi:hypothetical protein AC790_01015 [Pantoea sp. RIT-PI-b]|uniref:hypothetical protein n=1 Tax=Pantoea sp. RIT-PI-b TaxID=1681195 RepID=UPI000676A69D|nr:hypothetical protein [Pantoea sp. RIT-PI-b]KNC17581.1 hypothetical protein AC790_01015 [Pantoea sp. RIT-PI-b]